MSDLSLLDQLKEQQKLYTAQRDQAQSNFNQCVGALFATEMMIKKHEEALQYKLEGGQGHGGEMDSENAHEEGSSS
jgi:hypothetical protein